MKKCRHDMENIRKKNDRMLPGYSIIEKCRKCGMKSVPMGFSIGFLLKQFAQGLSINYEDLTPSLLAKAGTLKFPVKPGKKSTNYICYFPSGLDIKQANHLLDNPDKGIPASEL